MSFLPKDRSLIETRTCIKCGQSFGFYSLMATAKYAASNPGKYCSKVCADEDSRATIPCVRCGKEFKVFACLQGKRKYCSKECAGVASARIAKTCAGCGKAYSVIPSQSEESKFCSRRCHNKANLELRARIAASHRAILNCLTCGSKFNVVQSRASAGSKYCSKRCMAKGTSLSRSGVLVKPRIIRPCPICGKVISKPPSLGSFRTCGRVCAGKLKTQESGATPKESTKRLTTVSWKITREAVLDRDGHRCSMCRARERLVVHHKVKWRKTRNDDPSNLITVCRTCHNQIEHLA